MNAQSLPPPQDTPRPAQGTGLSPEPPPPFVRFQRKSAAVFLARVVGPLTVDADALQAAINAPGVATLGVARALVNFFGYHLSPAEDALLSRYQDQDTGADFWAAVKAAGLVYPPPATQGRPRHKMPVSLAQQTAAELYEGGAAIIDGRTGEHWHRAVGEVAMIHARPDSPLSTRFAPALSQNRPPAITADELERHLGEVGGTTTMLLSQVAVGLALQAPHATVSLDDLIRAVGIVPRTHAERIEARRSCWQALIAIECLEIHGARRGRYRDPSTKQVLDLTSRDRYLMVAGTEWPEQATLDGSDVPVTVTLAVGPWVERWRDNPQVLSRFGDVLAITSIPGDKSAGAYARGIGPALLQYWRMNAKSATVTYPGEDHKLVVKLRPVTRGWLAAFCVPPAPMQTLAQVLAGKNPGRARTYWAGAIKHLQEQGVIAATYKEPPALAARLPRKNWQVEWLAQPLDIPPGPKWAAEIAEIRQQVEKARRRRSTKPKK